jgi:hypothetical protein
MKSVCFLAPGDWYLCQGVSLTKLDELVHHDVGGLARQDESANDLSFDGGELVLVGGREYALGSKGEVYMPIGNAGKREVVTKNLAHMLRVLQRWLLGLGFLFHRSLPVR